MKSPTPALINAKAMLRSHEPHTHMIQILYIGIHATQEWSMEHSLWIGVAQPTMAASNYVTDEVFFIDFKKMTSLQIIIWIKFLSYLVYQTFHFIYKINVPIFSVQEMIYLKLWGLLLIRFICRESYLEVERHGSQWSFTTALALLHHMSST